jgi:hypothetical protein
MRKEDKVRRQREKEAREMMDQLDVLVNGSPELSPLKAAVEAVFRSSPTYETLLGKYKR